MKKKQQVRTTKIQLTIRKDQLAWLQRKQIYTPSKILQRAVDELMRKDP